MAENSRKNEFFERESIAIIAILAAMLMPALQQARETAKKIKCENNVKQVSMAFQNYAMDFKGFAPAHYYQKFKGGSTKINWVAFMRDELGYIPKDKNGSGTPSSSSLLACPSGLELKKIDDVSTHIGISGQMLAAGFIASITVGYSTLPAPIAKPLVILIAILIGGIVGALRK